MAAQLIASPNFRPMFAEFIWPFKTAGFTYVILAQEKILLPPPVSGTHDPDEHLVLEDGTQLRPQKVCQDPEGRSDHRLVLCDAIDKSDRPIPSNNRHAAIVTLNQPDVAAAELWFKIPQDYIFLPQGCSGSKEPPTWDFKNAIPDRDVVDSVRQEILEGCARAGIMPGCYSASGISLTANVEPCLKDMQGGISVADDVWILRFIVEKVATKYGLGAFDPNMIPNQGYRIGAAIRCMEFSTQSMRNARGYEAAKLAVHKLKMRDALAGEGNSDYKIKKIPSGYVIEVKMPPSHEMDPYKITSGIAETVLLWKPTVRQTLVAGSHTSPFLRTVRSIWNKLKRLVTFSSIDEQVLPL